MQKRTSSHKIGVSLAVILHVMLCGMLLVRLNKQSGSVPSFAAQSSKHMTIIQTKAVSAAQVNQQVQAVYRERARVKAAREAKILAVRKAKIRAAKQRAARRLARKKRQLKAAQDKLRKQKLLAKQKQLQDQLMHQQLKNDQQALQKITAAARQGAVNKYKAQILSVIQSNWRIHQVNAKLKCVYDIAVAPGGVVVSVRLVKSSGDSVLDQSARAAILRASPLPVPDNPALFDRFRHLVLTLSPKGFITS